MKFQLIRKMQFGFGASAVLETCDYWEARQSPLFAEVAQHSNTPETLYMYAAFLKSQNRTEEAREWVQQLLQKKGTRTLPRYWQRIILKGPELPKWLFEVSSNYGLSILPWLEALAPHLLD